MKVHFSACLLFLLFLLIPVLARGADRSDYASLAACFTQQAPSAWGMDLEGIFRRAVTRENVLALTFDACGSRRNRNDYDQILIDFLRKEHIPATLFLNDRWIRAHPETFARLAADPLFEIGGHGALHRPLSVTGQCAYGIAGTKNALEAVQEVGVNLDHIERLTGHRPAFFRSGTAHYDDVAVRIVRALDCTVAGYSLNGDCGASLAPRAVERNLLAARPGDIVLCHMNHPESGTAQGVIAAVRALVQRGFRFVTLSELAALDSSTAP